MRQRALSLGGTCKIESVSGCGTTIVVHVPLKSAKKSKTRNSSAILKGIHDIPAVEEIVKFRPLSG